MPPHHRRRGLVGLHRNLGDGPRPLPRFGLAMRDHETGHRNSSSMASQLCWSVFGYLGLGDLRTEMMIVPPVELGAASSLGGQLHYGFFELHSRRPFLVTEE
ncbi:hypothetical protein NL676_012720 [Syzygium grande]|nr:hypothetical protein NL676_012720 [Syzygium grande]